MADANDVGAGAVLKFSAPGEATDSTNLFVVEPFEATWSGLSRESVETTHWGLLNVDADTNPTNHYAAKTFIPSRFYDPGELQVQFNADLGDDFIAGFQYAAKTVILEVPRGGTNTASWTASGFLTGMEYNLPNEDRQTMSATIKLSGGITVATTA